MSDDAKMVSEREAVRRERAAFDAGALWGNMLDVVFRSDRDRESERRYPLPKVTRPRVAADPHGAQWFGQRAVCWRVAGAFDGMRWVECSRDDGKSWSSGFGDDKSALLATPERVALWADLLARPTEDVDDA